MNKKTHNNPFRRESNGRFDKPKKEGEPGKVKFNPVAKTASTQQATPWAEFKHEIIQKQKDDEHEKQGNHKDTEAAKFLKQREENYRRNLIQSQRNQPTKWEEFSDETAATSKSKRSKKSKHSSAISDATTDREQFIEGIKDITKNNFDSRKLSVNQNNFLKKIITTTTMKSKNKKSSLADAVRHMKFMGVKKK